MDWWARLSTGPIPGGTKQKRAQAPTTALGLQDTSMFSCTYLPYRSHC